MLNKPRVVPVLFCKPSHNNFVHAAPFANSQTNTLHTIAFRSLSLAQDLPKIHEWVNAPYAQAYWNMTGSSGLLQACYQCIQQNPHGHSFAGFLDEQLICQFDVYRARPMN